MQKLEDEPELECLSISRVYDGLRENDFNQARFDAVPKTNSSPVIAGDKVFLLERLDRKEERVRCFQLGNGKTLWEHQYNAPLPMRKS